MLNFIYITQVQILNDFISLIHLLILLWYQNQLYSTSLKLYSISNILSNPKSIYLTFLLLNFKSHVFDDKSNLFLLGFYWFTYTSFNLTSSFKLNLFYQNSNCISYQLIYHSQITMVANLSHGDSKMILMMLQSSPLLFPSNNSELSA